MWVFSRYGFFSCTCDTKHGALNTNVIMVRARVKEHIENLQKKFTDLKSIEIQYSLKYDYQYRIYVPKEIWAKIVSEIVIETDYGNFKSAVGGDGNYHQLLSEVWCIMSALE